MSIRDVGLVKSPDSRALGYGWHHGVGRRWLPYFLKRWIVKMWNPIACARWGHSWLPDFQTAEWSMKPCVCERPLMEGHDTEHLMPSNWTHDVCVNCRTRREVQR